MNIQDNRPGFQVVQGDIFKDDAQILVVPVNCMPGVMGAGMALEAARRYPCIKGLHYGACRESFLKIGWPVLVEQVEIPLNMVSTKDIVLFPTKGHWKNPSQYEWIFKGLATLYKILESNEHDYVEHVDIAMPALGCGLGGLEWDVVAPMISVWALGLPDCYRVKLYHTHGR